LTREKGKFAKEKEPDWKQEQDQDQDQEEEKEGSAVHCQALFGGAVMPGY
jgi:hypothetical protein